MKLNFIIIDLSVEIKSSIDMDVYNSVCTLYQFFIITTYEIDFSKSPIVSAIGTINCNLNKINFII